jgi:hypothetical protein
MKRGLLFILFFIEITVHCQIQEDISIKGKIVLMDSATNECFEFLPNDRFIGILKVDSCSSAWCGDYCRVSLPMSLTKNHDLFQTHVLLLRRELQVSNEKQNTEIRKLIDSKRVVFYFNIESNIIYEIIEITQ